MVDHALRFHGFWDAALIGGTVGVGEWAPGIAAVDCLLGRDRTEIGRRLARDDCILVQLGVLAFHAAVDHRDEAAVADRQCLLSYPHGMLVPRVQRRLVRGRLGVGAGSKCADVQREWKDTFHGGEHSAVSGRRLIRRRISSYHFLPPQQNL